MKRLFYLIAPTLLFASCERELQYTFNMDYTNKLVVNALMSDMETISVSVSGSVPFSSVGIPPMIENANVYIFIDGVKQPKLNYNNFENVYTSSIKPMAGRTYRILAEAPGYASVEATAIMPSGGTFLPSVFKDSVFVDSSGFPLGRITASIMDDPATENYYRVKLFYYESTFGEFAELPIDSEDPLVNQFASSQNGGVVFSDATFNGKRRDIYFKTPFGYGKGSPKFMLLLENLSKDYYLYVTSLNNYQNSGSGIFSEPVFVYTNVKDGLGIFAGYNQVKDTLR